MAALAKIFTISRVGAAGVGKFILKNWYLFVIVLVLIPPIIGAVKIGVETKNPTYPLVILGLSITNADALIYDHVQTLKENPEELIGVPKPEAGVWKKIVYYLKITKVAWKIMGLMFLITIPFTAFYRYYKFKGQKGVQSSFAQNFKSALINGFIFIFVMNMILIIVKIATNEIIVSLPDGTLPTQALYVIMLLLPFHGVVNLFVYLFTL